MFPLYDFLIYCFIAAYTPGANNLLSMSNAARLGFRRSVVFNFGITAGFFFVMSLCTLFSATLYNTNLIFSLQFMNPKIYIYAITAMSLYILPVYSSPLVLFGFVLVLTVIGASGSYVWALFGAAFCRFFARHAKAVNLVMALLLVYCAVSLFL